MIIWLRNYFDILTQHVGEQIVRSKENTTGNFINNKSSKKVSDVNGNGGLDLWRTVVYIREKNSAQPFNCDIVTLWWVRTAVCSATFRFLGQIAVAEVNGKKTHGEFSYTHVNTSFWHAYWGL